MKHSLVFLLYPLLLLVLFAGSQSAQALSPTQETLSPAPMPMLAAVSSAGPTGTPALTATATPAMISTPTPGPGANRVFTRVLSQGSYDSRVTSNTFYGADTSSGLGRMANEPTNHFFLFDDVRIAPGTTIGAASLKLPLLGSNTGVVNVRVAAQDTGNASAPQDLAEFLDKQAQLTGQAVDWNDVGTGTWGQYLTSPDLRPVIQWIVNRSDWASGNSILIWVGEHVSSSWANRTILNADCASCTEKPTLEIQYIVANFAPEPADDAFTTSVAMFFDPLQNDSDPDGDDLTITQVSTPQHGTASITDNLIFYIPAGGYAGPDTFTYTVSDGHNHTATATVNVSVVSAPIYYSLAFTADSSAVPALYYNDLTYLIHVGTAVSVSVTGDNLAIPSTFDEGTGNVVFTSAAHNFRLLLENPMNPSTISVSKAAMKNNKKWAWSHGMDDNMNLRAQVDLLNAKGWHGSLYLIANIMHDARDEGWIFDKPALKTLLEQGWALGNHTWDHECFGTHMSDPVFMEQTITRGYNKLMEIVSSSTRPTYQLLGFAAPCFASEYDPYIVAMRSGGISAVKFNESGGNGLMQVDVGAAGYSNSGKSAVAVSSLTVTIGRDLGIESGVDQTIASLDWMAANASNDRHFWYNTLSHGNNEGVLQPVADYAYNTYGPAGTNELWMAPSTEIFGYLLVRDNTILSPAVLTQQTQPGNSPRK